MCGGILSLAGGRPHPPASSQPAPLALSLGQLTSAHADLVRLVSSYTLVFVVVKHPRRHVVVVWFGCSGGGKWWMVWTTFEFLFQPKDNLECHLTTGWTARAPSRLQYCRCMLEARRPPSLLLSPLHWPKGTRCRLYIHYSFHVYPVDI